MADTILWVYIALLFAGGLMGFLKAGSKPSLIMSSIFAVLLILCVTKVIAVRYAPEAVIGFLLVFFGMRFIKGRKFMPAGFMTILSAAALAGRLFL